MRIFQQSLKKLGVGEDSYRDVLGIAEGCKEDKAGWDSFLAYLKKRGLTCPELFISDKCIGLIESLAEFIRRRNGSVYHTLVPELWCRGVR